MYLRQEKMTPRLLWENVEDDVVYSHNGYVVFDDGCISLLGRI
jgi:hypothetical protein